MPKSNTEPKMPNILHSHDLREITKLLLVHHGIHEGLFDLAVEFQIGVGLVGPDATSASPGASIGIKRVGLLKTEVMGPITIDAAEANPAPKTKAVAKKPAAKKAAAEIE